MKPAWAEFAAVCAAALDVRAEELTPQTAYNAFAPWDSVAHLRLVMEVEQHFGAHFALEEIPQLTTLEKLYERLD